MLRSRKEWLKDVNERQRNLVFPDTLRNEMRFWRNLGSGAGRLTKAQAIGVALLFAAPLGVIVSEAARRYRYAGPGSVFDRLAGAFGYSVLFLLFLGAVFLLIGWRARRALRAIESSNALKTRPSAKLSATGKGRR